MKQCKNVKMKDQQIEHSTTQMVVVDIIQKILFLRIHFLPMSATVITRNLH